MALPEPPRKKPKIIHDYFQTQRPQTIHKALPPPTPTSTATTSPTTTKEIPTTVPGVSLIPSFLSPSEQAHLLNFLTAQPYWRTDLSRRTLHFGGTYCLLPPRDASPATRARIEKTVIPAPPIPKEIEWLIDRFVEHGLSENARRPEYCIVNEYLPGQGISAHVESFRFDEPVVGLTLGNGDYLRFHELVRPDDGSVRSGKAAKAERTQKREDVWLDVGSCVVMRGEGRWRWQHEVVRGRKMGRREGWRRVSLTFRVERRRGR